ncbi:MAG TPA: carboxymuconolactone decarboxylase family protein, partial [Chthoniobacterales bacterium]
MNRPEQLRFHLPNAIKNGVKEQELIEAITHLAFYSGWPNAMSCMRGQGTLQAGAVSVDSKRKTVTKSGRPGEETSAGDETLS